jgi:hypothetical protein
MADAGFNGTTVTFATGTTVPLLSATFSSEAAEVPVSGCADSEEEHTVGVPVNAIEWEVAGNPEVDVGDSAACTVTWNDGTTSTLTNGIVSRVNTTGSKNNPITTTIRAVKDTT